MVKRIYEGENEGKSSKKNKNSNYLMQNGKYTYISRMCPMSNTRGREEWIRENLSDLGICYLKQLINPFDFSDSPIQSIHLFGRASKLHTCRQRFTFLTSTATGGKGYGFVSVTPYLCHQSTTAAIYYSQSTTTTTAIPTSSTLTSTSSGSITLDAPYTSSNYAANQREYRVVAVAIRCRNITQREDFGGSIIGLHTPNNGTGDGITYDTATDFEHTKPFPFNNEWTTVFWKPTHPDNHVFWSSHTTSFASPTGWSTNSIALLIQAPEDSVSQKVECEVMAVIEVTGYAERGATASPRDAEMAVKSISLLQNCCSYQGSPDTLDFSIPYDCC